MSVRINFLHAVPVIEVQGKPVMINSLKAEALLVYVFLSGERVFRRDFLASLFWEDRSLHHARDNLRQTIARIKRTCGDLGGAFRTGRHQIEVQKEKANTDYAQVLTGLTRQPAALDIHKVCFDPDDIMSGYHTVGTAFSSWVRIFRRSVEKSLSDSLTDAMERNENAPEVCDRLADMMLMLDPTNEKAVRSKMRHHAEQGQHAEAMRVYHALYHLLEEDYGVEPSNDTIALNAAIKLGQLPSKAKHFSTPTPTLSAGGIDVQSAPEICVNAFDILSEATEIQQVGKFFQSEVTANLSKFREWTIVDEKPDSRDHYELGGQVMEQHGETCAILTMRRNSDRRIIWSEQLVIGFEGWNTTQWRIAQQVSLAINQSLTSDRLRRLLRSKPEDRSVFDKWIMCYSLNAQWSPEASRTAIDTLQEITEIAPYFGPAHSYLADMRNKMHLVYPGVYRSDDSVRAALHHAEIAMNLDPLDPNSHRVLAWARALNGEYDVAEFHFQQAFILNPTHLHVRVSSALGFAFLNNLDRACALADETRALSVPLHGFHWGYFQNIYFLAGRLEDAVAAGERSGYAITNVAAWQAVALHELGRGRSAAKALEQFWALTEKTWQGQKAPDKTDMLDWFFHCFPLREPSQKARLEAGVLTVFDQLHCRTE